MSVLAWFLALPARIKEYAIAGAGIALAILYAVFRIRQSGVDAEKEREKKANDKLDTKLDKIDASDPSVDDALEQLRNRSGKH